MKVVLLKERADFSYSLFLFVCHLSPGQTRTDRSLQELSGSRYAHMDHQAPVSPTPNTRPQFLGHTTCNPETPTDSSGVASSLPPSQECAEPSCVWWLHDALLSACPQPAAGWSRSEQLLPGGGVAHLPTEIEQAEKC